VIIGLILVTVATAPFSCRAETNDQYGVFNNEYGMAQYLFRQGEYSQSLDKYVYAFQASTNFPAMYGVRLSFMLSEMYDLATKYPPAMEKLNSMRDERMNLITRGTADRLAVHEFVSLCDHLAEKPAIYVRAVEIAVTNGHHAIEQNLVGFSWQKVCDEGRFDLLANHVDLIDTRIRRYLGIARRIQKMPDDRSLVSFLATVRQDLERFKKLTTFTKGEDKYSDLLKFFRSNNVQI